MSSAFNVDVAIIGGGIAGLWLLARLREQGYAALLIENAQLGTGQTLCAQGIIHGGAKYGLHGQAGQTAEAVAGMPDLWRRCLRGEADIDLRGAALLAEHQYLWATRAPTSQLAAFFASKLMRGRIEKVAAAGKADDDYPPALRHPHFHGTVYRLDEPIIDVASVLRVLAERYRDAMVRHDGPALLSTDSHLTLRHPDRGGRWQCRIALGHAAITPPAHGDGAGRSPARTVIRALYWGQRSPAPDCNQPLRRAGPIDLVSRRRVGGGGRSP